MGGLRINNCVGRKNLGNRPGSGGLSVIGRLNIRTQLSGGFRRITLRRLFCSLRQVSGSFFFFPLNFKSLADFANFRPIRLADHVTLHLTRWKVKVDRLSPGSRTYLGDRCRHLPRPMSRVRNLRVANGGLRECHAR